MVESIRNLHIWLLIGALFVMQTMANDCPYSDPNCSCAYMILECLDLQEIPPLKTDTQINNVILRNGNITSISRNSLPPGVITMHLARHPLTNISDDAFDASSATLENLYIWVAKFTRLPLALKKLTRLTRLYIDEAPIHDWHTAVLKHLAETLNLIELNNVNLSAWPSWISDCRLLRSINLNWNLLKSVPDDAFHLIKGSLGELSLCGTGLTTYHKPCRHFPT